MIKTKKQLYEFSEALKETNWEKVKQFNEEIWKLKNTVQPNNEQPSSQIIKPIIKYITLKQQQVEKSKEFDFVSKMETKSKDLREILEKFEFEWSNENELEISEIFNNLHVFKSRWFQLFADIERVKELFCYETVHGVIMLPIKKFSPITKTYLGLKSISEALNFFKNFFQKTILRHMITLDDSSFIFLDPVFRILVRESNLRNETVFDHLIKIRQDKHTETHEIYKLNNLFGWEKWTNFLKNPDKTVLNSLFKNFSVKQLIKKTTEIFFPMLGTERIIEDCTGPITVLKIILYNLKIGLYNQAECEDLLELMTFYANKLKSFEEKFELKYEEKKLKLENEREKIQSEMIRRRGYKLRWIVGKIILHTLVLFLDERIKKYFFNDDLMKTNLMKPVKRFFSMKSTYDSTLFNDKSLHQSTVFSSAFRLTTDFLMTKNFFNNFEHSKQNQFELEIVIKSILDLTINHRKDLYLNSIKNLQSSSVDVYRNIYRSIQCKSETRNIPKGKTEINPAFVQAIDAFRNIMNNSKQTAEKSQISNLFANVSDNLKSILTLLYEYFYDELNKFSINKLNNQIETDGLVPVSNANNDNSNSISILNPSNTNFFGIYHEFYQQKIKEELNTDETSIIPANTIDVFSLIQEKRYDDEFICKLKECQNKLVFDGFIEKIIFLANLMKKTTLELKLSEENAKLVKRMIYGCFYTLRYICYENSASIAELFSSINMKHIYFLNIDYKEHFIFLLDSCIKSKELRNLVVKNEVIDRFIFTTFERTVKNFVVKFQFLAIDSQKSSTVEENKLEFKPIERLVDGFANFYYKFLQSSKFNDECLGLLYKKTDDCFLYFDQEKDNINLDLEMKLCNLLSTTLFQILDELLKDSSTGNDRNKSSENESGTTRDSLLFNSWNTLRNLTYLLYHSSKNFYDNTFFEQCQSFFDEEKVKRLFIFSIQKNNIDRLITLKYLTLIYNNYNQHAIKLLTQNSSLTKTVQNQDNHQSNAENQDDQQSNAQNQDNQQSNVQSQDNQQSNVQSQDNQQSNVQNNKKDKTESQSGESLFELLKRNMNENIKPLFQKSNNQTKEQLLFRSKYFSDVILPVCFCAFRKIMWNESQQPEIKELTDFIRNQINVFSTENIIFDTPKIESCDTEKIKIIKSKRSLTYQNIFYQLVCSELDLKDCENQQGYNLVSNFNDSISFRTWYEGFERRVDEKLKNKNDNKIINDVQNLILKYVSRNISNSRKLTLMRIVNGKDVEKLNDILRKSLMTPQEKVDQKSKNKNQKNDQFFTKIFETCSTECFIRSNDKFKGNHLVFYKKTNNSNDRFNNKKTRYSDIENFKNGLHVKHIMLSCYQNWKDWLCNKTPKDTIFQIKEGGEIKIEKSLKSLVDFLIGEINDSKINNRPDIFDFYPSSSLWSHRIYSNINLLLYLSKMDEVSWHFKKVFYECLTCKENEKYRNYFEAVGTIFQSYVRFVESNEIMINQYMSFFKKFHQISNFIKNLCEDDFLDFKKFFNSEPEGEIEESNQNTPPESENKLVSVVPAQEIYSKLIGFIQKLNIETSGYQRKTENKGHPHFYCIEVLFYMLTELINGGNTKADWLLMQQNNFNWINLIYDCNHTQNHQFYEVKFHVIQFLLALIESKDSQIIQRISNSLSFEKIFQTITKSTDGLFMKSIAGNQSLSDADIKSLNEMSFFEYSEKLFFTYILDRNNFANHLVMKINSDLFILIHTIASNVKTFELELQKLKIAHPKTLTNPFLSFTTFEYPRRFYNWFFEKTKNDSDIRNRVTWSVSLKDTVIWYFFNQIVKKVELNKPQDDKDPSNQKLVRYWFKQDADLFFYNENFKIIFKRNTEIGGEGDNEKDSDENARNARIKYFFDNFQSKKDEIRTQKKLFIWFKLLFESVQFIWLWLLRWILLFWFLGLNILMMIFYSKDTKDFNNKVFGNINTLMLVLIIVGTVLGAIGLFPLLFQKAVLNVLVVESRLEKKNYYSIFNLIFSCLIRLPVYLVGSESLELWSFLIVVVCGILALTVSYFFLTLPLLIIIGLVPILEKIIKAMYINLYSYLYMMLIVMALILNFVMIALQHFNDKFEKDDKPIVDFCDDLRTCFLNSFTVSLQNDGGLGDFMSDPKQYNSDNYFGHFFFVLIFFTFIGLLLLASLFSIIVDSFKGYKAELDRKEKYLKEKCYVCGLSDTDFGDKANTFYDHVHNDHSIFSYFALFYTMEKKNRIDFNGTELYIDGKLKGEERESLFPHNTCFGFQEKIN